tara:strand:- start:4721 stop:6160 length:1440 start_codon:yes stop_codon:yes gene_type:complete
MQHFYDGQIRRYITQMIRLMSNFSYKDSKGKLTQVPVMYGDMTRMVSSIIRDNSENKIPSAPRISVYVTGLEMDRTRTSDSSYVNKLNIRERAYDADGQEYLNYQGKNYTVERLMPTPYNLTMKVDIWSTNTEQKLQILEQILVLFNPSLEIQTTDNYVDWTSLSVVHLESMTFSSRAIPVGVDSEIDVADMTFTTPIYISPPVKVKRLGVIANIITSIFDESKGDIELGLSGADLNRWDDSIKVGTTSEGNDTDRDINTDVEDTVVTTTHRNYGAYVDGNTVQLVHRGTVGGQLWDDLLGAHPGQYQADISRIHLTKLDTDSTITGTIAVNELNPRQLIVNWDTDSFPSNSVINGPARDTNSFTTIDYIIDPTSFNPSDIKTSGVRILLLSDIGDTSNTDGPDAWKASNGDDLIASSNDIIEWTGSKWQIVFDASDTSDITYITNLTTNVQYRWDGTDWLKSVDGLYPRGTWRLALEG